MHLSTESDLRSEPFSRRGSYLGFRRFDETTRPNEHMSGLHLLQYHGARIYPRNLAEVKVNGIEPRSEWDEAVLTLGEGAARVDIVFDGTDALRLRGCGGAVLSLEFPVAPGSSLIPSKGGTWEMNARPTASKLRLAALRGTLRADTDWEGEGSSHMAALFEPDPATGEWEGVVDQFVGTWTTRDFRSWAELEAEVRADFADFLATLPEGDPAFAAARVRAAYVNWSSIVRPSGHFRRPAMLMSKNHMHNVWSWDHAFNAMAHMRGDPELAWDQMMLMADRQDRHGAFPDAQNDIHEHFNFCKPPIHGWAVSHLRAARPDFFTAERLRECLVWLEPWTNWWLTHRRWEEGGLPYYLHGNDSGWDNSTFFLRGVPVLTPDLPAFLVLQCRELAEIHRCLGQVETARVWDREADRLKALLLSQLWDGERFFALKLPEREIVAADTLIETIPLVLGTELPGDIRKKVVDRLQRYLTPHGLATEHPASPHYTSDGYWRGPIWAPCTLLLIDGLRRGGESALAGDLRDRYLRLCAASGFAENFDALTGAPLRDKAYTWTSSVFLILLAQG